MVMTLPEVMTYKKGGDRKTRAAIGLSLPSLLSLPFLHTYRKGSDFISGIASCTRDEKGSDGSDNLSPA